MAMDDEHFAALLRDLASESSQLAVALSRLSAAEWSLGTPAAGWDIHDQVVHLAWFGDLQALGFTHPDEFTSTTEALRATGPDWVDGVNERRAALGPDEALRWFTESHAALGRVLAEVGPAARTKWFGPSMSAASAATARLMETWAHGQDIYDALGLQHPATDRVRHVCHLGVITRGFAYELRGQGVPPDDVRVELAAPSGCRWTWGPAGAADRITGSAIDFALVVTQRRHRADTSLLATPGAAEHWLEIAQAFAGEPGSGRRPGQFDARPAGRSTGAPTENEGSP